MARNVGWGTSQYVRRSPVNNAATQLATTMTNTGAGVNSSGGISFNNPQQQGAQTGTATPGNTVENPVTPTNIATTPINETHVAVEPNSNPVNQTANSPIITNTATPPRTANTPGTGVDPAAAAAAKAAADAAAVANRNALLRTGRPGGTVTLPGGQGNVQANLLDRSKNVVQPAYDPNRTETSPNWLPSTWAPINNFQQAPNTPGDLLQMGMAKGIDPRKYATQAEWYNALLPALGMDAGWASSPRA